MRLVTRAEWGAAPARGTLTPLKNAKGVVVHWFGGDVPNTDHSHCAPLVKGIQDGAFRRTDGYYLDIEYNLLVCQHGYVFVGRGVGVEPAAQLGANAEYFAVCALSGPQGVTAPTSAMLEALDEAIADIRATGPAGAAVLAHHDVPGNSTDCPGANLLGLCRTGYPFLHEVPTPAPHPEGGTVTVLPFGDGSTPAPPESTLWGIAEKYLGNGNLWRELAAYNGIQGTEVQPGEIIKLPPKTTNA